MLGRDVKEPEKAKSRMTFMGLEAAWKDVKMSEEGLCDGGRWRGGSHTCKMSDLLGGLLGLGKVGWCKRTFALWKTMWLC